MNESRKSKIFLGGTCNSSWRDDLVHYLNPNLNYFNPIVDDWNEKAQKREEKEKWENCNIHLYLITPRMTGVYSIAEVMESIYEQGLKRISTGENAIYTYFGYLPFDYAVDHYHADEWSKELKSYVMTFRNGQRKSLDKVGNKVEKKGGIWVRYNNEGYYNYLWKFAEELDKNVFAKDVR